VGYDVDTKKWFSNNCIDYPEILFDTYEEMKDHLDCIEYLIVGNGFSFANL
jgi:hypothetical protein